SKMVINLIFQMEKPFPSFRSDCCSCQEKWIGYQCNCYFISNESKTWKDSRNFCISHNSSLLQVQNRNELDFMNSSAHFYWIGLSFSEEHNAWLWEDNSTLSQDLVTITRRENGRRAIYSSFFKFYLTNCGKVNTWVCIKKNV
uniref:NKG2-D type II integral membrane protein n=1 Tax=Sus scrofa TaxID=9823 RepID=A0A8D0QLN6_PIG